MTEAATFAARFVVTGTPIPWQRMRQDPRTGRRFPDKRSAAYQRRVAAEAQSASRWQREGSRLVRRSPPWPDGSKCAKVIARMKGKTRPPKCDCSWCSTSYRVELLVAMPDRRTRDIDNCIKQVMDACTGILWRDDRQVIGVKSEKVLDRDSPRIECIVTGAAGAQLALVSEPGDSPFDALGPDGWETMRAREWLEAWRISGSHVDSLASLLRDCWASGFLEGMDAGAIDEKALHDMKALREREPFGSRHLRLVQPPKEPA